MAIDNAEQGSIIQMDFVSNLDTVINDLDKATKAVERNENKINELNRALNTMNSAMKVATKAEEEALVKQGSLIIDKIKSLKEELQAHKLIKDMNDLKVKQAKELINKQNELNNKVQAGRNAANLGIGSYTSAVGPSGSVTSSNISFTSSYDKGLKEKARLLQEHIRRENAAIDYHNAELLQKEKQYFDSRNSLLNQKEAERLKKESVQQKFQEQYGDHKEVAQYNKAVRELDETFKQGYITQEQYAQGVKKAHEHMKASTTDAILSRKERAENIRVIDGERKQLRGLALQWHDLKATMSSADGGTTLGHKIGTTAQYMTAGMGLMYLATTASNAVQAITEADKAIGMFQGVLQQTRPQAEALGKAMYDIGSAYGGQISALNETALSLGRAGVAYKDLAEGVKTVSQLALISGESLEVVSDVLVSWKTVYAKEGITDLGNAIVTAANVTKASVDDLQTMSTYILTAGQQAGLTSTSLLALAGSAKQIGLASSTAGTSIRRFFMQLDTGSKDVREAWSKLGVNLDQLKENLKQGGTVADTSIKQLFTILKNTTLTQGGEAIKDIGEVLDKQTIQALLAMAKATGEKGGPLFAEVFDTIANESQDAAEKGAEKIALTYSVAWERIKNTAASAMASFGSGLTAGLFDADNVSSFNTMMDNVKVTLDGVFKALGVVVGAIGSLASFLDEAIVAWGIYKAITIGVTTHTWLFATSSRAATTALGAQTASTVAATTATNALNASLLRNPIVIGAIVAGTAAYMIWDTLTESTNEAKVKTDGLTEAIGYLDGVLKKPASAAERYKQLDVLTEKYNKLTKSIATARALDELPITEKVSNWFSSGFKTVVTTFDKALDGAKVMWDGTIDKLDQEAKLLDAKHAKELLAAETKKQEQVEKNIKKSKSTISTLQKDIENLEAQKTKTTDEKKIKKLNEDIAKKQAQVLDLQTRVKAKEGAPDIGGKTPSKADTSTYNKQLKDELTLALENLRLEDAKQDKIKDNVALLKREWETTSKFASKASKENKTAYEAKAVYAERAYLNAKKEQEYKIGLINLDRNHVKTLQAAEEVGGAKLDIDKAKLKLAEEKAEKDLEYAKSNGQLVDIANAELALENAKLAVLEQENKAKAKGLAVEKESFLLSQKIALDKASENTSTTFKTAFGAGAIRQVDADKLISEARGKFDNKVIDQNELDKQIKEIQDKIAKIPDIELNIKLNGFDEFSTNLANTVNTLSQLNTTGALGAEITNEYTSKVKALDAEYSNSNTTATRRLEIEGEAKKLNKAYNKQVINNNINQIGSYGELAGALAGFTKKGSNEYKTLMKIQKTMYITQMAMQMAALAQQATTTMASIGLMTAQTTVAGTTAIAMQAGSGDPYTAFARVAAMAGLLASFGILVGGALGKNKDSYRETYDAHAAQVANEGKGTVWGDSDAVSESIKNSLEEMSDLAKPEFRLITKMTNHLQSIDNKIGGVTNLLLRNAGFALGEGFSGIASNPGMKNNVSLGTNAGNIGIAGAGLAAATYGIIGGGAGVVGTAAGGTGLAGAAGVALPWVAGAMIADKLVFDNALTNAVGGVVNSVLGGVFGKSSTSVNSSLEDAGLTFGKQLVTTAINDFQGSAYQTVKTVVKTKKKSWTGSSSSTSVYYNTYFEQMDEEIRHQFELILNDMYNSVIMSAEMLNGSKQDLIDRLADFEVNLGKISLKGLSGQAMQEKLSGVFGKQLDEMVTEAYAVSDFTYAAFDKQLSDFQDKQVKIGRKRYKLVTAQQQYEEAQAAYNTAKSAAHDEWLRTTKTTLDGFRKVGETISETLFRVGAGIQEAEYYVTRLGYQFNMIDYKEIYNQQGEVSTEVMRQVITKFEETYYAAATGIRDIVSTLSGTAEEVYNTYVALDKLRGQLGSIGHNIQGLTAHMIVGAGGVEQLSEAMESYFDNYLTDEEKVASQTQALTKEFAKLGLVLPESKQAYKDLLSSIDLTTTSGQDLYGRVILLAESFSEASEASEKLKESLNKSFDDVINKLRQAADSTLKPQESVELFYRSMLKVSQTDKSSADYYDLLNDAITKSSVLSNTASFKTAEEMRFAQLETALQFEAMRDGTLTQIDYLAKITNNTNGIGDLLASTYSGTFVGYGAPTVTPFAKGGIVTGPTVGLIGEAGYNEAVIPLKNPNDPLGIKEVVQELKALRQENTDMKNLLIKLTADNSKMLLIERAKL